MDRRTFLTGYGGISAIAVAGCTESGDDEPTTPNQEEGEEETTGKDGQEEIESSPKDVLEELRDALGDETPARFRELLHSDSPAKQQLENHDPESGERLTVVEAFDHPVEMHERIEETHAEAAICGQNRDGEPIARFDFRAQDDEWRLWDAVHTRVGYYPDDPEAFGECGRMMIRIHWLPEPARLEAETALENGRYETDAEPYLPHLLNPDDSYLVFEEDDGRTEYRLRVERDGAMAILGLEETIASWGEAPLAVENDTGESVTVSIRVERTRTEETIVDETLTVDPDADAETEAFDRELGSYTATIDADEIADDDYGWDENEYQPPLGGFRVTSDGVVTEPRPTMDPIDCRDVWKQPVEFSEHCEPIRD